AEILRGTDAGRAFDQRSERLVGRRVEDQPQARENRQEDPESPRGASGARPGRASTRRIEVKQRPLPSGDQRPDSKRPRQRAPAAVRVGGPTTEEPASPAALETMPPPQAIGSTIASLRENSDPITAGTIRKLNTSSTPAVVTELVTTMPNDRKNAKSHSETASVLRLPTSVSPEIASRGFRASQWNRPIAA